MNNARTGADALIEALHEAGVRYLFGNFGSDHAGVIETLARAQAAGQSHPRVIVCPHEVVALSAAHGFAQACGQPQAVFVHCDVGTANLGGAVHNAARGRVPVFIFAGATPFTLRGELPGSRNRDVNFTQDVYDQRGIVRPYVKWEYDLRTAKNVKQVVRRALTLAASDPQGPVYLVAARETLEEDAGQESWTEVPALAPAGLPPDGAAELAEALSAAKRPLILTTYAGRDPAAMPALVRLAERLAIPVVELRATCVNFPADHPLHLGYDAGDLLAEADVVLALDCELPWLPAHGGPRGAAVYSIDVDPLKEDLPLWEIPAARYFKANSVSALAQLHACLDAAGADAEEPARRERRVKLAAQHARQRDAWRESEAHGEALDARFVAAALRGLLEEDAIIVDEAVTNSGALRAHLPRTQAGTFYANGGSALGWALGAAIGVKLAAPRRTVVALVGDGSYFFGAPAAAYWTARHANAPFLTVILNNGGWNATKQNVLRLHPDGAAARERSYFSQFEPSAELARVAEAAGGALARTVATRGQLKPALGEALAAVRAGRAAVVDVRLPAI